MFPENWHHKVSCVLWRFIMCTWLALEFTLSGTQRIHPLCTCLWFSRERKAVPHYRKLSTLSKYAGPSLFTIDTAISKRQEFYSFHFKNFGNTKLFLFTVMFFLFHYWRKLRGKSSLNSSVAFFLQNDWKFERKAYKWDICNCILFFLKNQTEFWNPSVEHLSV